MKRSLSFTDLKDLTPGHEINTRNVRKIQSCTGRFEDSDTLSPDFFDELLEEYEQEDHLHPAPASLPAIAIGEYHDNHENNKESNKNSLNLLSNLSPPSFTTHDLTALLSFVQSNPPTLSSSVSASIFPNNNSPNTT